MAMRRQVKKLDQMIAEKMGFKILLPGIRHRHIPVKWIHELCNVLAGIAASAHKFSNDIRLLTAFEGSGGAV